jgi:hypothetical protein
VGAFVLGLRARPRRHWPAVSASRRVVRRERCAGCRCPAHRGRSPAGRRPDLSRLQMALRPLRDRFLLPAPGPPRDHQPAQAVLAHRAGCRRPGRSGTGSERSSPHRHVPLDVFGTANFFNFLPLAASIELLTGFGIERIGRYVDELVAQILDGLDGERYRLVSSAGVRSSLVVVEPLGESPEAVAERLAALNIYVAWRRGWIRVSPHLYNSPADVERLLEQL